MKEKTIEHIDLFAELRPESELERRLLRDTDFIRGLLWGTPRYGHPEGEVYKHVREVLDNIEQCQLPPTLRSQLRLIAFAHDTFKYAEDKSIPRDWSRHHGPLARLYMEQHTDDALVLDIIELHDEAYYAWRLEYLYQQPVAGEARLDRLLQRIEPNLLPYYLFFKADTETGDKNQAPLKWFQQKIRSLGITPPG